MIFSVIYAESIDHILHRFSLVAEVSAFLNEFKIPQIIYKSIKIK